MKLLKVVGIVLAVTVAVGAYPRRAEAISGLGMANPGLAIAGGITMGAALASPLLLGSLGCVVGSARSIGCASGSTWGQVISTYLAPAFFIIGVVLLPDDSGAVRLQYGRLSAGQAEVVRAATGLSDAELTAYHEQLEEVNVVTESIAREMAAAGDYSPEFAAECWEKYRPVLSAEAFTAVGKISAFVVQNSVR